MRFSLVLSLMPLAGFVGGTSNHIQPTEDVLTSTPALRVTQPAKGDEIKASDSLTVKWTYVE